MHSAPPPLRPPHLRGADYLGRHKKKDDAHSDERKGRGGGFLSLFFSSFRTRKDTHATARFFTLSDSFITLHGFLVLKGERVCLYSAVPRRRLHNYTLAKSFDFFQMPARDDLSDSSDALLLDQDIDTMRGSTENTPTRAAVPVLMIVTDDKAVGIPASSVTADERGALLRHNNTPSLSFPPPSGRTNNDSRKASLDEGIARHRGIKRRSSGLSYDAMDVIEPPPPQPGPFYRMHVALDSSVDLVPVTVSRLRHLIDPLWVPRDLLLDSDP